MIHSGSVAALVLVAVPLLFFRCDAQFSLAPSFVVNQTGLVVAEGIAWEMTVHQDSPKGKGRVKCSTPNGYYTKYTVVDPLTSQGEVYLTYDINGSTICYAYAVGTLPYPFPPTVLHYNYLKPGTYGGTAMPLYEVNVNRYRLHLYSNFQSVSGSEAFRVVQTNPEAMNQLQDSSISNNTESPSSVFDLPPACSQGSVRRLRATQTHSTSSATVDPFHVTHLGMIPPEVKFNVRDARHAHEEFRMVIDEAMAVLGPKRLSEYRAAPHAATVTSIDNRAYATAIRDQGTCGGCWAFSTAALTETVYNYKHNITNPVGSSNQWVSVQNILDCATGDLNGTALFPSKGCFGGWPLVGLTHIVVSGVVAEARYTYDAVNGHHCLQSTSGQSMFPLQAAQYIPYGNAPATNVPLLMSAIVTNGAVIAIMNADPILFYGGGIFTSPCAASLGHAVTLVGFGSDPVSGTDYWIVKNSFGAAWGEGGFFRIARGVNLCGIEQMGFVAVAA